MGINLFSSISFKHNLKEKLRTLIKELTFKKFLSMFN